MAEKREKKPASMPTQTQYQYTGNTNPNNSSHCHQTSQFLPPVVQKNNPPPQTNKQKKNTEQFLKNWNLKSEDVDRKDSSG